MSTNRKRRAPAPRAAHEHLHRLLDGHHAPGEYHWQHVLAILHTVTGERTPAHERVLRRAAVHEGTLRLDPRAGLPHALPPEEMVRCVAVRQLAKWDREGHARAIRRAAAVADHERAVHEAAAALRRQ